MLLTATQWDGSSPNSPTEDRERYALLESAAGRAWLGMLTTLTLAAAWLAAAFMRPWMTLTGAALATVCSILLAMIARAREARLREHNAPEK